MYWFDERPEYFFPEISEDRGEFEEGNYLVFYWADFPKLHIEEREKPKRVLNFPRFEIKETYLIKDEKHKIDEVFTHALKVRNCLSIAFGQRITTNFRVFGKDLLYHNGFSAGRGELFTFGIDFQDKSQGELNIIFKEKYKISEDLIKGTTQDSFEDILIRLKGTYIWSDDILDRFLHRWRIIELISNAEFKKMSEKEIWDNLKDEERKEVIKNGIHIKNKILATLRKRKIDVDKQMLIDSKKVRDKVFHGNLVSSHYKTASKHFSKMLEISERLITSYLKI